MPDDDTLSPATDAGLVSALAYGLRSDERGKAHRQATELTVRIGAEMLVRYLGQAGSAVMTRPAAKAHSTPRT